MDKYFYHSVSEETFASWLDGTLSATDEQLFIESSASNAELQELLDANDQIDENFEEMIENGYELPAEFQADFDLPVIHDDSAEVDEYVYDDVEPYELEGDEDDSDACDDNLSYHETCIVDDYEPTGFDIL